MKILLTGGAGFIGSHTLIELTEAGHEAVVVDNLDNSSPISLKRVAKIIGKDVPFYKVDIRDREGLQKVFDEHKFDACIHFAGLKAVGESCAKPLEYYCLQTSEMDTSIKLVFIEYFLQTFSVTDIYLIERNIFTDNFCNTLQ
jgi:UDP-glucose 4-epimerase